jgi:protein arginine kinase activator
MLCCLCKEKEAKVHLTQIVGNKMQKVDLCDDCAKEKGVDDPTGSSLAHLLLGLGASPETEPGEPGSDLKCPNCGFTQADFKKTGRLGCPTCYDIFGEGLDTLLKSMHKGTHHAGKVPAAMRRVRDNQRLIKSLQDELQQAVAKEDFEQAARLRDQIRRAQQPSDETAKA